MTNSLIIRNLKKNDIKDVLEIYNYYILNELGNFEEEPLLYKDFLKICENILNLNLPFLVCLENNKILGFTYLTKFRNKSGYRFAYENSIYINKKYTNKGIGNKLLKELIITSSQNSNIRNIIAVISDKNSKGSIKIHKNNGFTLIGTIKKVGFKKKQWLDSIYMQKILNEKN